MTVKPFAKWQPLDAQYVDPSDIRAAQLAQSAATVGGKVARFRLCMRLARDPYKSTPPTAPQSLRPVSPDLAVGGTLHQDASIC